MKLRFSRFIAASTLGAVLLASPVAFAITKEEVITLTKLGISDDEVIKAIDKDRTIFNLQIQDILALKQAGVTEGVIKHMLSTPQLYGKPATLEGGTTQPTVTQPETQREKTPEEMAAEEQRIRQEAAKLAEEAKKVRESQQKAYAQGVLKEGQELAKAGRFVEAIQAFQNFVAKGGYAPGSEEFYIAKYGIANALKEAGLLQSAAKNLVEVVLEGPDRPFFQPAFNDLMDLRTQINYSPPDLEELTKFYVGNMSQQFQDNFNYLLGEFFYDFSNFAQAVKYLDLVSPASPDYAKSLYLKGLVQVRNQLYRSALDSFQNAILATERNDSNPEVGDLAYLALARIAYESGDYDAAIYYYRKVPRQSTKLPVAFYESAWTYFVKGDYTRALGTFQALHSPVFDHYFYPELWILEGTAYLNMCRYDLAREAIDMFNKRVASLQEPMQRFMTSMRTPADFYTAVLQTANGQKEFLPKRLTAPVLANVDFFNLYRTIQQIEREQRIVQDNIAGLGAFGQELAGKLATIRQSRVNEIGIKIQQVLKRLQDELQQYAVKVTEIEVDLQVQEMERIDVETQKLFGEGEEIEKEEEASGEGAIAIVGADSMQWPFEGEYWSDEIGSYRSFITEVCTK
jgi:tetratricopeptide (TPR) repeat protein